MQIFQNFSLKNHTTFRCEAYCKDFVSLESEQDLFIFLKSDLAKSEKIYVIGDGSNTLFTKDFEGCIVQLNNKGIEILEENEKETIVEVAAGESWEDLIDYCISHNLGGIENLTGIPGRVGSSPVQNIGAYGVEVKDCIKEVKCVSLDTAEVIILKNSECEFSYRNSIFKNKFKEKCIITSVVFHFSKKHEINLSYSGVRDALIHAEESINISTVRNIILEIRNKKIPDHKKIGTAGSFFKNPELSVEAFSRLQKQFPEIPSYTVDNGLKKVPAAWFIDRCGWKAYRKGDAGVYEKQALILVNYGNATGTEIKNLSEQIIHSVYEKFNVKLETEVNIL